MRDHTTEFEQRYTPKVVRIHVPLTSVVSLRRIADELRGLANRLDYLSRTQDKPTTVLNEAWFACKHTVGRVNEIRAPGRPRKSKHKM